MGSAFKKFGELLIIIILPEILGLSCKTKISYKLKSAEIHLGIFDRNIGQGVNSIHISRKSPSFPQIGFDWQMKKNLNFIYFHGFLNSSINDSSRSIFYENEISQRIINIPRNIAFHRIEWKPTNNLSLGLNESVIYSVRNLPLIRLPFLSLAGK